MSSETLKSLKKAQGRLHVLLNDCVSNPQDAGFGALIDILDGLYKTNRLIKAHDEREQRSVDRSVLPHNAIEGDCCGCLYATDNGDIKCNECGKLFIIDAAIHQPFKKTTFGIDLGSPEGDKTVEIAMIRCCDCKRLFPDLKEYQDELDSMPVESDIPPIICSNCLAARREKETTDKPTRRGFSMRLPALLELIDTAKVGIGRGDTGLAFLVYDNKEGGNQVVHVVLKEPGPPPEPTIEHETAGILSNPPTIEQELEDGMQFELDTSAKSDGTKVTRIYLPMAKYDEYLREIIGQSTDCVDLSVPLAYNGIPVYSVKALKKIHYCTGDIG